MRLVLMGAPGAGKGTQGEVLARRLGVPRLSTGDMIREAVSSGSDLGRRIAGYYEAGDLVPDDVVLGLFGEAFSDPASQAGFVLDGFPRTPAQADGLDRLLQSVGLELDIVVTIDAPDDELVRRLSGRRVCSEKECGAVTHLNMLPPGSGRCPACGRDSLSQRSDDGEEIVRNRLLVYREQTRPVWDYFLRAGARTASIDGVGSPEEVGRRLADALGVAA